LVQSEVSPYSGFKEIPYWSGFFRAGQKFQVNVGTARKKLVGERGPEKELPLRGTPAESTG